MIISNDLAITYPYDHDLDHNWSYCRGQHNHMCATCLTGLQPEERELGLQRIRTASLN